MPTGAGSAPPCSTVFEREAHHLGDDVEHRDRDHGAVPGALPVVQRGEHRGVGVERRADVGDGYTRLRGRPGQAGDRAGPALGLHEQVVGALVVQRSAGAVPGDVDDDQPRVPLGQVGRGEAEAAERARRQVADQHVGPAEQAGEHLGVGRFGQVELHRLLAVVQPDEVGGEAAHRAVVVPGGVPHPGVLHLDHPGAEVGEVARAQRGRDRLLERQHGDACERAAHLASSRFSSSRPTISFWISLVPS